MKAVFSDYQASPLAQHIVRKIVLEPLMDAPTFPGEERFHPITTWEEAGLREEDFTSEALRGKREW